MKTKESRWLEKALSKDMTRPNLHYVHPCQDRVFATDGIRIHRLHPAYVPPVPRLPEGFETPGIASVWPSTWRSSISLSPDDIDALRALKSVPTETWTVGFHSSGGWHVIPCHDPRHAKPNAVYLDARYVAEALGLAKDSAQVRICDRLDPVEFTEGETSPWDALVMPRRL